MGVRMNENQKNSCLSVLTKLPVRGSHNSEKKNKAIDVIVTHRSSRDTWGGDMWG